MKIVDRNTFLAMPSGTVFQKYAPCYVEDLRIKGDTWENCRDFLYEDASAPMLECDALDQGLDAPLEFAMFGRDGCFDEDQLFAVWSNDDVCGLIERLQLSLGAA